MNELKQKDVMRALECCASGTGGDACNGCPFNERNVCDNDMNALEKAALALLREKDAEIERLNNTLADALVRAEVAKVETITEMESRLEQIGTPLMHTYVVTRMDIKQVVKDMKEGNSNG